MGTFGEITLDKKKSHATVPLRKVLTSAAMQKGSGLQITDQDRMHTMLADTRLEPFKRLAVGIL